MTMTMVTIEGNIKKLSPFFPEVIKKNGKITWISPNWFRIESYSGEYFLTFTEGHLMVRKKVPIVVDPPFEGEKFFPFESLIPLIPITRGEIKLESLANAPYYSRMCANIENIIQKSWGVFCYFEQKKLLDIITGYKKEVKTLRGKIKEKILPAKDGSLCGVSKETAGIHWIEFSSRNGVLYAEGFDGYKYGFPMLTSSNQALLEPLLKECNQKSTPLTERFVVRHGITLDNRGPFKFDIRYVELILKTLGRGELAVSMGDKTPSRWEILTKGECEIVCMPMR